MRLSAHSLEAAAPDKAPTPSFQPGPRGSSPVSQESASAAGVTWAATPQCPACRPRAGSFPARLEQLPRPPIKFAQDLPLRTEDFGAGVGWGGGCFESQKVFSLGAPNRPQNSSLQRLPRVAEPSRSPSGRAARARGGLRRPAQPSGRGESARPRATFAPAQGPADPGTQPWVSPSRQSHLKTPPAPFLPPPRGRGSALGGRVGKHGPGDRNCTAERARGPLSLCRFPLIFLNLHCFGVRCQLPPKGEGQARYSRWRTARKARLLPSRRPAAAAGRPGCSPGREHQFRRPCGALRALQRLICRLFCV